VLGRALAMTLDPSEITRLLEPFGVDLDGQQLDVVGRYLDLLTRWSRAVSLTAIRRQEEIVTRHFGESIYVTKFASLDGPLLDIGSGAGFPGLAMKIVRPDIRVVLLEPVTKKRAFLKEVVRECQFRRVEVIGARAEDFSEEHDSEFQCVTLRAVGDFEGVLPAASKCLSGSGRIYAWLTAPEASRLSAGVPDFRGLFAWSEPIKVPLSRDREIWVGRSKRST
jgi:16S rRNA (guanine527-N7)-methyltransferase